MLMLMVLHDHDCGKVDIDQHHNYEENTTTVLIIPYIASPLIVARYKYYTHADMYLAYYEFHYHISIADLFPCSASSKSII